MIEAVRRFGVFKGFYLGIKRLGRCQPMCEGGFDPVPQIKPRKSTTVNSNTNPNSTTPSETNQSTPPSENKK